MFLQWCRDILYSKFIWIARGTQNIYYLTRYNKLFIAARYFSVKTTCHEVFNPLRTRKVAHLLYTFSRTLCEAESFRKLRSGAVNWNKMRVHCQLKCMFVENLLHNFHPEIRLCLITISLYNAVWGVFYVFVVLVVDGLCKRRPCYPERICDCYREYSRKFCFEFGL